jgi:uncharacterized damage-inducible protein DinB
MNNAIISRPDETEYLPYFGKYISLVPEGDIIDLLRKQLEETLDLLREIPEAQAGFRYGDDKWSIKELVGHVIDAERIFAYRALRFARNDQTPLSGFEQDDYISNAAFDERSLDDLASEFESVRRSTIFLFKPLNAEASMRTGLANGSAASVRALAYMIAGHELHHRNILRDRYLQTLATESSAKEQSND